MAWIYLVTAGCFEVACTTLYRYTDGLTRFAPTAAFFALGFVSLFLLNRALTTIPMGTAYAVWTGIGAAGTALLGVAFYDEPATVLRILCLVLLIGAIIGLKLTAAH